MKRIVMLVFFLMFSSPLIASQEEYDDCILKHLKGVKLDMVAHNIKQACYDNYKSPSFTNDKKKAYNECLLEHLTGVESLPAALEIKDACSRISKRKSKIREK